MGQLKKQTTKKGQCRIIDVVYMHVSVHSYIQKRCKALCSLMLWYESGFTTV